MIKAAIITAVLFISHSIAISQGWDSNYLDSIHHEVIISKSDTGRIIALTELSNFYKLNKPDSSLYYGYKAAQLAREIEYRHGQVLAMLYISIAQRTLGDITKSSQVIYEALKIAEQYSMRQLTASLLAQLGVNYTFSENHQKALTLYKQAREIFENKNLKDDGYHPELSAWMEQSIGLSYLNLKYTDSATYYCQLSYDHSVDLNASWVQYLCLYLFGTIEQSKKNLEKALDYHRQSIPFAVDAHFTFLAYYNMAVVFKKMGNADSSIYYSKKSLELAETGRIFSDIVDASILLGDIYENHDTNKALQYRRISIAFKDSLYYLGKKTGLENIIAYDEQQRQFEIETAKSAYKNKIKQYALISGLGVFLLIAGILFHNNREKQKANKVLKTTLSNLKSTQSQLIQAEKMASLGELTAGIAHEIQNPLNFVNNFSEVNEELLTEMKDEMSRGKIADAVALANDAIENQKKINHHGRRADAIVKGMLQHSRAGSGAKEPTDINALADEYLRLAYHGLKAKDKSFNATIKTDFDNTIGTINIIPQDIGRVILNLINNAFYACTELCRSTASLPSSEKIGRGFSEADNNKPPIVWVSTKKENNKVLISVRDNGPGIPANILDKIFQPFFTTKPTGQGTGLGLSLSYDIVKAHGGELMVNTDEGHGTEFIIQLPAKAT